MVRGRWTPVSIAAEPWTRVQGVYSRQPRSPRKKHPQSEGQPISKRNAGRFVLTIASARSRIRRAQRNYRHPKGSRNKFSWDERRQLFSHSGVLPIGAAFPYDFGFLPNTLGEDGDALDVLVLMDEPAFVGCLVASRLLGVIEAKQTEEGKTMRNDRLIAVAVNSRTDQDLKKLSDLNRKLVDDIEHFFVSYNEAKGKKFKPLGRFGPAKALQLVKRATRARSDRT